MVPEESVFNNGSANPNVYHHTINDLPVNVSGYLYIYVSNESPNIDVFFDNLQVTHTRGPLVEETHYYPFGLAMHGISSKALNDMSENRRKYQSYELNSDFDLNFYETFYRSHDPQIGRFLQMDPKPNLDMGLYTAMGNNPVMLTDPLGDTSQVWIVDQYYYLDRDNYGGISYYDKKGNLYEGYLDEFAESVLNAANSIARIKDEEVQKRLNEVLKGKKMITIMDGLPVFEEHTATVYWYNNEKGNGIALNNRGNFELPGEYSSKYMRSSDLTLVHEWLGHAFLYSRGLLNNERMDPFVENGKIIGWAHKTEADAATIVSRAAIASGRAYMTQPVYVESILSADGQFQQKLFHVIPIGYSVTNSESQKQKNYRR